MPAVSPPVKRPITSPPWTPNRSSVLKPMSQTATGAFRSALARTHRPWSFSPQAKKVPAGWAMTCTSVTVELTRSARLTV